MDTRVLNRARRHICKCPAGVSPFAAIALVRPVPRSVLCAVCRPAPAARATLSACPRKALPWLHSPFLLILDPPAAVRADR